MGLDEEEESDRALGELLDSLHDSSAPAAGEEEVKREKPE